MPCLFVYNLMILHNSVELRPSASNSRILEFRTLRYPEFNSFPLGNAFQSFNIYDIEVHSIFQIIYAFLKIWRWRRAICALYIIECGVTSVS